MNTERRKQMGLEIGRAIHMNMPIDVPIHNRQELYDEIMKVAESFCDKTAITCGLVTVSIDAQEIDLSNGTVEFMIPLDDEEWMAEHLRKCEERDIYQGSEAETQELIPDTAGDTALCECPNIPFAFKEGSRVECSLCGKIVPPDKL